MPYRAIFSMGIVTALAATAFAQEPTTREKRTEKSTTSSTGTTTAASKLSGSDRQFLQKAYSSNAAEIEMARHATEKATDSSVKAYAQKLMDDHTANNQELSQLMEQKGMSAPATTSKSHDKNMTRHTGAAFDQWYAGKMVQDHQKNVSEFERHSSMTKDPDVKAYVDKTLPKLREHLEHARQLSRGATTQREKTPQQ